MKKITKLTKKQIELQTVKRDEWINLALHEHKYDKEEMEAGVKWLYYISNLKEPKVVIVNGPKDFSKKLWDSVGASVRDSVRDSVWDSVSWTSLCGDAEFGAWYEYWKESKIIKQQEKAEKYIGYLKSGAFYTLFFEKVAFVMIRPTIVKQDDRKRLHSEEGPALAFSDGTEIYKLHGVKFEKEWWEKIVNDTMTPEEIFAIDNLEHRRIAYEYMDKTKMKQLKDYKILDEQIDEKGNQMKIISFKVKGIDEPIKYYNCICPTTKREYFVGTDKDTCQEAKLTSFGLDDDNQFVNEW